MSVSNGAQKSVSPKSAQNTHKISFAKLHKNLEAILKVQKNLINCDSQKCTKDLEVILKVHKISKKIILRSAQKILRLS